MNSRLHPNYKTKCRASNWAESDRALVQRSDITLWSSTDAADSWTPGLSGSRGGQREFSDQAIETALVLMKAADSGSTCSLRSIQPACGDRARGEQGPHDERYSVRGSGSVRD
ncbi:MAG: hypothetical protein CL908_25690 [Deltaproteobacteria bacterium]|nr:hypothetical protein [Deltaproteobacteria bacterium]